MSDASLALASLTPEQRVRLADRLRERRRTAADDDRITPRPDQGQHPLSPAQERIWKLSRLRTGDPVYNVHEAKRLRGPLDVDALRRSFAEVVRRHEALRATFLNDAGTPRQRIAAPSQVAFDVEVDVDGVSTALEIARREAEQPFDLACGPLVRVRVLRLAEDDHVLLVTAHHIVVDGRSMGIIESEVSALYCAEVSGGPPLGEPELQFADVAHWQRDRGAGVIKQALEYWATQLGPGIEPLRLPGDDRRPATRSSAGAHHGFELSSDLTAAVRRLSQAARVTPFVTLMAAFFVLLHRHTGQEDLLVCSPVAGRDRREIERMVGYFNNLIVIRGDLSEDPSFHEVLRRLHPTIAAAFDHQRAPFQQVAALPHLSTTPLARALFVLQDAENRALSLPDVDVTTLTVEAATADFDLGVFVRPEGDRLVGAVRYHTDQFDAAAIESLLAVYKHLLGIVTNDDAVRLSALPSFVDATARRDTAAQPDPRRMQRPRTALEAQLSDIWERLFRVTPISIHDDFFALGGHSLLAAELAAEIEQHITGDPLPLATLLAAPTIAELAELIDGGEWTRSWSSLVPIDPTGTRPALFFVHAHGGNVIGYRDLARRLGPDQPLYGLQSPEIMRDGEGIVEQGIPDMAKKYLREIRDVQPHGPYHLGGWCLGGDVAFEMATLLAADGEDVATVIMVDNPRPSHHLASTTPLLRRFANRARSRLAMELSNLLLVDAADRVSYAGRRVTAVCDALRLRVEDRLARALERLRVHVPPSRELRQHRIAQMHEKAYKQYDPPIYDGRVVLFRAQRQPIGQSDDPSLGWSAFVTSPIEIHDVPGHRVGMLSEPRVAGVAAKILAAMDHASG